jgi:hypothetical protein
MPTNHDIDARIHHAHPSHSPPTQPNQQGGEQGSRPAVHAPSAGIPNHHDGEGLPRAGLEDRVRIKHVMSYIDA